MSRDAQAFLGYDGVLYFDNRRNELVDMKIEALERELAELRKLRFEIPRYGWTSYSTKEPASPEEPGWRFASDRDGNVYPELKDLVDRIFKSGKVARGGFTFTLSKDGKFIQRRRLKK